MLRTLFNLLLVGAFSQTLWAGNQTEAQFNLSNYKNIIPDIVDGKVSTKKSFHSRQVVMLLSENAACSGTIIANNAILTAAHCTSSFRWVVFGNHDSYVKGVEVSKYVTHPGYNGPGGNDIALVFFEGGLPGNYTPMALPPSQQNILYRGQEIYVAGYGRDENKNSGTLKYLKSIIASTRYNLDGSAFSIDNDDFSGSGCFGDSGGSSFVVWNNQNVLVGVTSALTVDNLDQENCRTKLVISMTVSKYMRWIKQEVKRYNRRSASRSTL